MAPQEANLRETIELSIVAIDIAILQLLPRRLHGASKRLRTGQTVLMLAAGILNSLGGLFVLLGAFLQARKLYREYKLGHPIRYEGDLDFWPSFKRLSFAGENGWTLVFVGGALVFVGSIIATIAAA